MRWEIKTRETIASRNIGSKCALAMRVQQEQTMVNRNYRSVWWCMVVYGDVWWRMVIYGEVYWSLAMYVHASGVMGAYGMYGDVWWCMMTYGLVWWGMEGYGHVRYDEVWWGMLRCGEHRNMETGKPQISHLSQLGMFDPNARLAIECGKNNPRIITTIATFVCQLSELSQLKMPRRNYRKSQLSQH